MNKKLLIILSLLIILNFISISNKSYAEPISASLVALYGPVVAEKLLAFILICASAGVTFHAVDEAKALFDKWQMDSNNWQPPADPGGGGGGSGNGWRDIIKNILVGGIIAGASLDFIERIKDWFKSLGAKEGQNNYTIISETYFIGDGGTLYDIPNNKDEIVIKTSRYTYRLFNDSTDNNINKLTVNDLTVITSGTGDFLNRSYYKKLDITVSNSSKPSCIVFGYTSSGSRYQIFQVTSAPYDYGNQDNVSDTEPKNIIYNVTNNSYVITNIPPSTIQQPNITNLPDDKIKTVVKPNGKVVQQYEGDTDDLVDDILENTPADELINPVSNGRYTIYEIDTETGKIIEIIPESDYLPFPEVENPEIPENELQGQGIIINFLKSIVNWLYNIWRLPQQLIQTFLMPSPDYLKKKIDTIQTMLNSKLENHNVVPLLSAFEGLT